MNLLNLSRTRLGGTFVLLAVFLAGCSTYNMTNPPRSVTEQLLLSTAADRAIAQVSLTALVNKKIYVDGTYFDSYDPKYVLGSIRDAISRAGGLLVASASNSDIIVEARSGALSIDESSSLIGLPQTGLPIPLTGVLSIPEIALYKGDHQHAIAKLALLAYDAHNFQHVLSSGPMVGKSKNTYYKLLGFIQWTSTDIPEKKSKKHR